jgi:spore maturation protein CgeB
MRFVVFLRWSWEDDPLRFIIYDIIDALNGLGHKVEEIDLRDTVPLEEVVDRIKDLCPDVVFTLNDGGFTQELCSIMEGMGILYPTWITATHESLDGLRKGKTHSPLNPIFVCDKMEIPRLKNMGLTHLYHLPLAVNPNIFKRLDLSKDDIKRYGCEVSFVGSSHQRFISWWWNFYHSLSNPLLQRLLLDLVELRIKDQREDVSSLIERLERSYEVSLSFKDRVHRRRVLSSLRAATNGMYRERIIEGVLDFGIDLYGDEGWRRFDKDGAVYRGWIGRDELPKLYNASKINLNICLGKSTLNLRFYEIMASGGFQLVNYLDGLGDEWGSEEELVCYHSLGELREKMKYYLDRPEERMEIAKRGQERTLAKHTYRHRMEQMIEVIKEISHYR